VRHPQRSFLVAVGGQSVGKLARRVEAAVARLDEDDPEPGKLRAAPSQRRLTDLEPLENLVRGRGPVAVADVAGDRERGCSHALSPSVRGPIRGGSHYR